jgi:hypothetical protein
MYSYYGSPNDYQYPSYSIPYYSYYGSPNDDQYPSYSIPYYSSYVIPTYYSKYPELPNSTNTTPLNSSPNPSVQESSSITKFVDIYIIVFIGMVIDIIMNIL